MKTERHFCPACRAVRRLPTNQRHWCACNKPAPYRMYPVSVERLANAAVGALRVFTR